jgi:hypothetical protein
VPNTAAALPEVSKDGLTWTIRIRKGVYFSPDPVFNNQKRELIADDYVYAWKRLLDPKVRSPYLFYVEDKLVGADPVLEQAKKTGKFDLRREVRRAAGARQVHDPVHAEDARLRDAAQPDADADGGGRARSDREVRGAGKQLDDEQPGGNRPRTRSRSGSARTRSCSRRTRTSAMNFPESATRPTSAIMAQMKGKKLPAIGRIDISIIEEDNPRLLAFDSGQTDYEKLPYTMTDRALVDGKLKPEYAKRGIGWYRVPEPGLIFAYFNMEDPVVGGYERRRLRCAARWRSASTPRADQGQLQGTGAAGGAAGAAERVGPRSERKGAVQIRSGRGARAARQVRLQGLRRRRLSRNARMQADVGRAGQHDDGARPRDLRAVEEEHGCDRHPDDVHQPAVARAPEEGEAGQAADVAARLVQLGQ